MRNLLPALLACLLTGCGASTFVDPAVPPCDLPVALPDRALSDRDIEIYWGRDRDALRTCGLRLAAVTNQNP